MNGVRLAIGGGALALLATTAALFALPAGAETHDESRTIAVTGSGSVHVAPDRARVVLRRADAEPERERRSGEERRPRAEGSGRGEGGRRRSRGSPDRAGVGIADERRRDGDRLLHGDEHDRRRRPRRREDGRDRRRGDGGRGEHRLRSRADRLRLRALVRGRSRKGVRRGPLEGRGARHERRRGARARPLDLRGRWAAADPVGRDGEGGRFDADTDRAGADGDQRLGHRTYALS